MSMEGFLGINVTVIASGALSADEAISVTMLGIASLGYAILTMTEERDLWNPVSYS